MPEVPQYFVNQDPQYDRETVTGFTHTATHEQAKPLLKIIKHMLQPRHPKTKRWTKPVRHRKTRKEQLY